MAAISSDFAVAQFRFLERLLLVHGHWCYRRISMMICYFFYKNIAFGFTLFWFEARASFSGQPAYNVWYMSTYNVFFISLLVFLIRMFPLDSVLRAAISSDFAVAQFRFLERLLLVHGHWCYRRISMMICYFFYKNIAFGFTLFWFEARASFSGQPAYNDWYMSTYNVFFISLLVFLIRMFPLDSVLRGSNAGFFPDKETIMLSFVSIISSSTETPSLSAGGGERSAATRGGYLNSFSPRVFNMSKKVF
ncbi:hypothetical protein CASFOL_041863 [Castilleja foliolosa]|uniref:P-type ATPase C-terminal domain-containing protein n=1 Tax=Castilleja foliolosa TaxID=1961234 RepID=A0ABD3B9G9_9LAMI